MADADGVVGKIKDKAKAAYEGLMTEDSPGDADPDLEYEPAPEQEILHDGMVVLNKSQAEEAGVGGKSGTPDDSTPDDSAGAEHGGAGNGAESSADKDVEARG